MLTIKGKIILASTLVLGLMLTVFGIFMYEDTKDAESAKLDARLESYAAKISTELGEPEDEPHSPAAEAQTLRQETDRRSGLRARLIAPDGGIIADDTLLARNGASPKARPARGGERFEVNSADGSRYRVLRISIEINDNDRPILELAVPMSDMEEHLHRLLLQLLIGIPVALVIMALAVYAITALAFRPMVGMVETAEQISGKNLDRRLTLPLARDEVRHLAETLNCMIDRIEAAFRSQKQFVADASHEIRTPLTIICSELEFVARQTADASVRESVATSLDEIDRLTRLTDGLLLLAKLDAAQVHLTRTPVRLDELLLECVQRIDVVARKKEVQLNVDLPEEVEMSADRDTMQRIFMNLLDNAVKYSPPRSVVTASLGRDAAAPGRIVLRIGDQGPGIPASALPHIFTRFYRADPSRSEHAGAGLGLAIVKELVGLHGGTISVTSDAGKGSVFLVELPAEPERSTGVGS